MRQLGRRGLAQQPSLGQEQQLACHILHVRHDVRRDDHDLLQGDLRDEIAHRDALPRVQPGRRLIEDENVRLVQNGLRQQQALLHAAGEAADRLAAHVGQADRAERPVDALQRPRARHAAQRGHVQQEALRRKARIERLLLGHIAHTAAEGRAERADLRAVEADLSRRLAQVPGQDIHERALACAVRPEQAVDAARQLGRKADQRLFFPVIFAQGIKCQFHHPSPPPSQRNAPS